MVTPEPTASAFPDEQSLCERCGYPLRGLEPDAECPECGLPVAASDPAPRVGPPWRRRASLVSWLQTVATALLQPRVAFRGLSLAGTNAPPRLFLLTVALLVGVGWWLLDTLAGAMGWLRITPVAAWAEAMVAVKLCLLLTYLEALGIWFFAGRRGWRVPLWLAERLACYAAAGWLVTLPLAWGLRAVAPWLLHYGAWLTITTPWAGWGLFILWAAAFAAVILPFEFLVYLGVRQVRYANAPAAAVAPAQGRDEPEETAKASGSGLTCG